MSMSTPLIISSMDEQSIAHYRIEHDNETLDQLKSDMFELHLNSYLVTLIEEKERKKVVGSIYLVSSYDAKDEKDLDELSKFIEEFIFSPELQKVDFDRKFYSYVISKINLNLQDDQDPFLTEQEFLQLSRNNFSKYAQPGLDS